MQFGLFQRLDRAQRDSNPVRFQHDSLALCVIEPEHLHENLDDVLHGVHIIIMQKDLEKRNMGHVLLK